MKHNKLVRDRIPDIIRENGSEPVVRFVVRESFKNALHMKLKEEILEFEEEPSAEELADILEVLMALAERYHISWIDVGRARVAKRAERGGFDQGVWLVETKEKE